MLLFAVILSSSLVIVRNVQNLLLMFQVSTYRFFLICFQVSVPAPSSPPRNIAQPRPTSNPALVKAPEPAKPAALVDLFSLDAPTPTKSTDLLNSLAQAPLSSEPAKTTLESEV